FEIDESLAIPQKNELAINWFESKFNQQLAVIESHFEKFRISDALMATYKLIWDDFCAWYLESIKPEYESPIDRTSYDASVSFFERIIAVLHPFMPFITEELWHAIKEREEKDCLIVAPRPTEGKVDQAIIDQFAQLSEVISAVRNVRNSKGMSPKEKMVVLVKTDETATYDNASELVMKLAGLESFSLVKDKPEGYFSVVINADEVFIELPEEDPEEQLEELKKQLAHTKGFLIGVEKKLSNERFVGSAPEKVVAMEKKKKADAEAQIKTLEESLAALQ
ncbi:MAG: class I tRNA ligase family protein, partial [Cyclobacteriaceae bacterium]